MTINATKLKSSIWAGILRVMEAIGVPFAQGKRENLNFNGSGTKSAKYLGIHSKDYFSLLTHISKRGRIMEGLISKLRASSTKLDIRAATNLWKAKILPGQLGHIRILDLGLSKKNTRAEWVSAIESNSKHFEEVIFTDGSKRKGTIGWGVWHPARAEGINGSLHGDMATVLDGEITAIAEGLKLAGTNSGLILTDSQCAISKVEKFNEGQPPRGSSEYRLWKALEARNGSDTGIVWVKAHIGITGNEEADRLASEATGLTPKQKTLTTEGIRQRIKEVFGLPGEFAHLRNWDRHNATKLARLFTGKGALRAWRA
ncbi:ribonuclease H-like domain-containing protein [Peziza echinospora]|nr:ribonuclease H-like domain-containing protein [Peziza echinospora]